jgi:hypothetical protein
MALAMNRLSSLVILVCLPACRSGGNARAPEPVAAPVAAAPMDGARCTSSWLTPPAVEPSIAVPADGGAVLLHAAGVGTQNYACQTAADGGTGWALLGPAADLSDCRGAVIGHHFASDGGAAAPEWQSNDGTFVIGHKLAALPTDGGAASVPSLLLQAVARGGSGALSQTAYVQRLDADGGAALGPCNAGDTLQVPYAADYYFYGR